MLYSNENGTLVPLKTCDGESHVQKSANRQPW